MLNDHTLTTENYKDMVKDENKEVRDSVELMVNQKKNFKELSAEKDKYFDDAIEQQKAPSIKGQIKGLASSALSAIGNTVISAGVGILAEQGLSLALKGIDALVHWDDNIIAKGQEAKSTILAQNEAYKNQKSQLTELGQQYTKLASGVRVTGNAIKNVSLSDDEFQSFLDTSNQIANIAPSMINNWDSEGNAILKFGTNTKQANSAIEDYIKLQRDTTHIEIKSNLQDEYKGTLKEVKKAQDKYNDIVGESQSAEEITEGYKSLKEIADEGNTRSTFYVKASQEKDIRGLLDEFGITPTIADTGSEKGFAYTIDTSNLSSSQLSDLSKAAEGRIELAKGNEQLVQSELQVQQAVQESKWKDLLPSLQAYVDSSNMFDKMDTQTAENAKKGINTMLSNMDISKMTDAIDSAGGISNWIDKELIAPMTTGSKDVQEAWANLFSLEDEYGSADSKMTVGEWAKKRNKYLDTIAKGTGKTRNELAERLGYRTAEDGWSIKNQNDIAAARLYGKNYDEDQRKEIGNYLNSLTKDNYEIAIDLLINGDDKFSSLKEFRSKVDEAIGAAQEDAEKATVSLDAMTTAVASAKTGLSSISTILTETTSTGGISSDNRTSLMSMFSGVKNGDEEVNLNRLFSTTADGVKLNVDALKDYIHYQQEATDKKFSKGIENQIGDLKDLRTAWQNATGDEKDTALENLKNAQDDYVAYMQQQSEWQAIKKQQDDLLSQYTQWQTAQSTENAGDKYNNIYSGLKNAKDAYDKGLVGTDDFKTFAALISPTGSDDAKNFAENYGKAVRYLTEDKTGVNNFLADLKAKGMASYDKSDDRWSFNIDNMDRAAQSLGIGTEFMKANFGRLRDYGIDNNFISSTEEGISRVKELSLALAEEEKRLDSLDDNLATNDTTRSASQKKIAQYKEDLKETTENLSEYYGEDYTQQAAADFDGAAIAVQQLDKSIDKVKKDSTLTAAEKNSMISKMIAEQTELAAEQYSSIEDLRNHDTSSLTEGLDTDSTATVSAIEQINQAYEDQNTEVTDLIDTLSQYSSEQLEGINFNDGKWDTELGDAEKAVESLCDKLGLTKDQTQEVIDALKEAGKLKDSTNSSDESNKTKEIKNDAKEAQENFNSLTGKTYKIDLDTTDLDTAHKQVTDLSSEVDKYRDRDGKYHSEISGGEELQTMYTGAISHEQDVEYSSTAMSQADSSSSIVKAAQDFMQAKNEMDIQTQLYQKGMDNTLDQATQDANAAFETLQQAQTDSGIKLVDTDNIQTAEDQLLQMSNDDIQAKVDVQADTSEAESDISNLQNLQGSTITMTCDVANEESFEQAKSTIESMPTGTTATVDIKVNGEEDVEKATELIESAPTNGSEFVVNCHVENAEDLEKLTAATDAANAKGANIKLNASVGEVDTSTVSADTEVPVKGKLEMEPYSGEAIEVNAKANITGVVGGEGVEVSLNAKANVTEAPTVPDTTVKATAHVDEAPEVPDANGNAHYENDLPTDAGNISGFAHYDTDLPTSAPDITGTVTYYAHIVGAPSGGSTHGGSGGNFASGTMTSVAYASGSAYNVLNMKPLSSAYDKGDVALKEDQKALVNEQKKNGHSESIVRDGVWSLIPGGAHFENLKKGDIIFSAQQTDDLLKHGATPGHARTYAQGTTSRVTLAPAFASGSTNTELDNKIKEVSTQAKDWISVALDRLERIVEKYKDIAESNYTNYKSSERNYNKALTAIKQQLKTQKNSRAAYVNKANEVASAVGLSEDLKRKVQNGTINIETLSEDNKKRVEAYQEWYEKILDCDKAIRQLTISQKDLAKAKVDRVIDAYDTVIGKRENKADYYKAQQELRVTQGYNQKPGSKYEQYMKKELYYTNEQKRLTDQEISTYKGKMKEYLSENGHRTVDPEYQKMKKQLYALQTTSVKLANEAAQLVQALQDNREQIKQWAVDRWNRAGSKQDAAIDYKLSTDNPDLQIAEKDYTERIKTNNNQIETLQKLREEKAEYYDAYFSSGNNEEAQKYLDEIAKIDEQILNLGTSTEELKNKIMELRWKPFEDAQSDLSNVINEYQTMQKLLGDTESFYNDNGSFSENGLTNILLIQESIDATKQKIANYREALDKLDEQYKNGCYSQEEYQQKSQELLNGIQQESVALSDLQQNMLSMYETQAKTENDLLQKNIDKRLEALDAKEKYYDYDKTLKKKSKDINALKAQIAALEGTSNAAGKARLEKLKAELADAEDDMQDTVHQHETEMKKTGFENLQTDAENALDNTLEALKKNTSFQEAVINNMLDNVKLNYDSTYSHLHDVMDQYGLKVSNTFDKLISKSADFNTSLASQTKAMQEVINMATNLPTGGVSNGQGGTNGTADGAVKDTANNNQTASGAGKQDDLDNITYTFALNRSAIYLTPNESYTLQVKWSPKVPLHSDVTWSSNKTNIAKVSSSGKVTATKGVQSSSNGKTTGTLVGGVEKTYKAIITAKTDFGSKTCAVYVMPLEHYNAIHDYANKRGLTVSDDEMQTALKYAYKNGGKESYQSNVAVDGFVKTKLNKWFNNLPESSGDASDIPSDTSALVSYFMGKGKNVNGSNLQELANILGIKTPGVTAYDTWSSTLKNKILKAYKSYGFATGGIINKLIPADMNTLLGKAIISNGDQGFIGAKVGETVMTEEFTRLLKPSITAMNGFTNMFNPYTPSTATNDYTINNEININVANMNSDLDIRDVANKVSTIINKNMTRDWKKLR